MAAGAIGLREAVGSVAVEPEPRPLLDGIVSGSAVVTSGPVSRESPRAYFTRLLKALSVIAMIALSACGWNAATATSPPKASAEILGTRIFVRQSDRPAPHAVAFDVPLAGNTTLRLVNGAKIAGGILSTNYRITSLLRGEDPLVCVG